jgi:hypothetical protein
MNSKLKGIIGRKLAFKSSFGSHVVAKPASDGSTLDLHIIKGALGPWETFTLQEEGENQIAIRSVAHETYWSAKEGGEGSKVDLQAKIDNPQKFVLTHYDEGNYWTIKTNSGTFIRANATSEGAPFIDQKATAGESEKFYIQLVIDPTKGRLNELIGLHVSIRTAAVGGKYLSTLPGGKDAKFDLNTKVTPSEIFTITDAGDNKVVIRSSNATYLSVRKTEQGFVLDQQIAAMSDNEKFAVALLDQSSWSIKSAIHGVYINAVVADGDKAKVDTTSELSAYSKFNLEIRSVPKEIFEVQFNPSQQNLVNKPLLVKQVGLTNESNLLQTQSCVFNEQMFTTYCFTQTEGLKVADKILLRQRLPCIVDGKFEVGAAFTTEWIPGKIENIDYLFSAVCPVVIPPHCKVYGRAKCVQTTMNVPWSATVSFHGLATTKRIGGVWSGTLLHDVSYCIEQPKLIVPTKIVQQADIPFKDAPQGKPGQQQQQSSGTPQKGQQSQQQPNKVQPKEESVPQQAGSNPVVVIPEPKNEGSSSNDLDKINKGPDATEIQEQAPPAQGSDEQPSEP